MLMTLEQRLEKMQIAIGRIEQRLSRRDADKEFSVFSQWGEDGLLDHLVSSIEIPNKAFVEFGVEDYRESNTRFLLTSGEWRGLVLDGSAEHVASIRADNVAWRYGLKATQAFITTDNISALIRDGGITGDIGILSVDIDGNDYWVWKAIEGIHPRIVVTEYNGLFGPTAAVTVPYKAEFTRGAAHYSNLYYGASAAALTRLANARGYVLVGGNRAGSNLFFVRRDVLGPLREVSVADAYRPACFRESRNAAGELSFLDRTEALSLIGALPVVDLDANRERSISEVVR
ncbi:MAG TPA: hypothetical protein VGM90_33030 [Kofleriaceae bacterium]